MTLEEAQRTALQPHYARTPDHRVTALRAHHDDDAMQIASAEVYPCHIKYPPGSAAHFSSGHTEITQFTLADRTVAAPGEG
ncbi:hypothetical protein ACFWAY_43620 [Rhodococcus sp. NPDC059968]|uniref:hypothetical protein n=1 Tax=Rhodococcus sp. NPDC059968 TaxID=3347017 RepID=UPI00366A5923